MEREFVCTEDDIKFGRLEKESIMDNWVLTRNIILDISNEERALRVIALFAHSEEEFVQVSKEFLPIYKDIQIIFKDDCNNHDVEKQALHRYYKKISDLEYFIWTHMDNNGSRNMENCENGFNF